MSGASSPTSSSAFTAAAVTSTMTFPASSTTASQKPEETAQVGQRRARTFLETAGAATAAAARASRERLLSFGSPRDRQAPAVDEADTTYVDVTASAAAEEAYFSPALHREDRSVRRALVSSEGAPVSRGAAVLMRLSLEATIVAGPVDPRSAPRSPVPATAAVSRRVPLSVFPPASRVLAFEAADDAANPLAGPPPAAPSLRRLPSMYGNELAAAWQPPLLPEREAPLVRGAPVFGEVLSREVQSSPVPLAPGRAPVLSRLPLAFEGRGALPRGPSSSPAAHEESAAAMASRAPFAASSAAASRSPLPHPHAAAASAADRLSAVWSPARAPLPVRSWISLPLRPGVAPLVPPPHLLAASEFQATPPSSGSSARGGSPDNIAHPAIRRIQFAVGGAGAPPERRSPASSVGSMTFGTAAARVRPSSGLAAGTTPSPFNLVATHTAAAAASSPARAVKDIAWLRGVCRHIHDSSSFMHQGVYYPLTPIGRGQHSGVYAISDELVVRAFLIPEGGKRDKGPSVLMLTRIKEQAYTFLRDGLSVAKIKNDPTEDGYVIQERIHGAPLAPLSSLTSDADGLIAATIKQFIDYAQSKRVVVDLQLSNFVVNEEGKPVLVDYYEEALDDDDEVDIEQKKFLRDFLKAFCVSPEIAKYLTQDLPEELIAYLKENEEIAHLFV